MKSTAGSTPVSYRLAVASRVLAAVFGGYLLAALGSVCITLLLPVPRGEATVSGMMSSFVFYLLAVLWCFACRSAWRAWGGVLGACLALGAIAALSYWMGRP